MRPQYLIAHPATVVSFNVLLVVAVGCSKPANIDTTSATLELTTQQQ